MPLFSSEEKEDRAEQQQLQQRQRLQQLVAGLGALDPVQTMKIVLGVTIMRLRLRNKSPGMKASVKI